MLEQIQNNNAQTLDQPDANTEHQLDRIEGVPSTEVFASEEQLSDLVLDSMKNGTITTSYIEQGRGDFKPFVRLDQQDVDETRLQGYDKQYKSGTIGELPFRDIDVAIRKTEEEVSTRVGETVFSENSWYLTEPNLKEDVANGRVSEQFIATDGKREIRIVNFSGTKLTDEQAEQMHQVIKTVSAISGGASFDAVNAICFLGSDKFKGDVVGSARGVTGVIVLNESLINGEADARPDLKFKDIDQNGLETTLAHEMAHLVELKDPQFGAYAKGTGWETAVNAFTDDQGNAVRDSRSVLKTPSMVAINDKEDKAQMVSAVNEFGVDQTTAAKPVTRYAYTNEREDLAEAFVVYANSDRDDVASLDSLRRGALEGVMRRAAKAGDAIHGPLNIQMIQLDPSEKIGARIIPKNYTISEPHFTYSNPENKGEQAAKAKKAPTVEEAYTETSNTFVDDYGNEVTKYNKRSPITH